MSSRRAECLSLEAARQVQLKDWNDNGEFAGWPYHWIVLGVSGLYDLVLRANSNL